MTLITESEPSRVFDDERTAHWVAFYRDLHAHPELSTQEVRTAQKLAEQLRASGFTVTEGVGGTGVVGILENGAGPTVMLRGDMDGLPILEETDLPWRSRHRQIGPDGTEQPTMHACGHDMHVTALAAGAELLAASKSTWSGTLMIVGQPAEETAVGARDMLEDGLFTRFPKPDIALGQHVGPMPVGRVGHAAGLVMAACANLDVTIFGKGGHGSMPANTVDPVVAAAYAITRLQAISSREAYADDPVVVTVGVLQGGTKSNIIPETVHFTVNLRARSDETMERTIAAVRRIVQAEAEAAGSPKPAIVHVREHAPATVNTADAVERVFGAHQEISGTNTVMIPPLMGSEDFSEYGIPGERYPGDPVPYVFWFWGGMDPARFPEDSTAFMSAGVPGNHSARFELVDAPTIDLGARLLSRAALEFLAPH